MKTKLDAFVTADMWCILKRLQKEKGLDDVDVGDIIDGIAGCVDHAHYQRANQPTRSLRRKYWRKSKRWIKHLIELGFKLKPQPAPAPVVENI